MRRLAPFSPSPLSMLARVVFCYTRLSSSVDHGIDLRNMHVNPGSGRGPHPLPASVTEVTNIIYV